jgi:uncharacterized protein (TIGR00251 family)
MLPCLQPSADGIILRVRVQPRSSRNQLVGLQGDLLKLKLCSPPVDGAANKSCCDYLAKLFGLSKSCVTLIAGSKARQKRILLQNADLAVIENILRTNLSLRS